MNVLQVTSRQPRRLTLAADAVPPLTVGSYVVARVDGGYSLITVTAAWLVGVTTVELALSAALEPAVPYRVSLPLEPGAPSGLLSYAQPANQAPPVLAVGEDPAAEAYGVDISWLSGQITADGDMTRMRGRACLLNDVVAVALIAPRELYHRPDDGAGLVSFVNASGAPITTDLMRSRLKKQWLKDPRIATVDSIDVITQSTGLTKVPAKLTEAVLGEQLNVVVPGG